jgi:membrane protein implicated in regulation of membrane protease activity
MAVRNWHPGKLVLLWGIWAFFVGSMYVTSDSYDYDGVVLSAFVLLLPLATLTWRWFSGREVKRDG